MNNNKKCPVCGELFTPLRTNQIYCSIECRAKNANSAEKADAARIRNRNRMRALREKQAEIRANEKAQQNAERVSELEAEVERCREERRVDLERRTTEGDLFALMQTALAEHDGEIYWELRELWAASEKQRIKDMFN